MVSPFQQLLASHQSPDYTQSILGRTATPAWMRQGAQAVENINQMPYVFNDYLGGGSPLAQPQAHATAEAAAPTNWMEAFYPGSAPQTAEPAMPSMGGGAGYQPQYGERDAFAGPDQGVYDRLAAFDWGAGGPELAQHYYNLRRMRQNYPDSRRIQDLYYHLPVTDDLNRIMDQVNRKVDAAERRRER